MLSRETLTWADGQLADLLTELEVRPARTYQPGVTTPEQVAYAVGQAEGVRMARQILTDMAKKSRRDNEQFERAT